MPTSYPKYSVAYSTTMNEEKIYIYYYDDKINVINIFSLSLLKFIITRKLLFVIRAMGSQICIP